MLGPGIAGLMQHVPLVEEDAPLDKLFNELTATISRREWRLDWADDRERAE